MVLRFALVLLFFNCVTTAVDSFDYRSVKERFGNWNNGFLTGPSALNDLKVMKLRKRDTQVLSEGGAAASPSKDNPLAIVPAPIPGAATSATSVPATPELKLALDVTSKNVTTVNSPDVPKSSADAAIVKESEAAKPIVKADDVMAAVNATTATPNTIDLGSPGVIKRAAIVFGGFALLGVAYYVVFRKKNNNNDTSNNHEDSNQFRYGVLRSYEQRDNQESGRIPLTMDSDEDDDEDLEIFDLEQKKKSLSYVNLQPDDEEFVIDLPNEFESNGSRENERNNLLLDIEDRSSDTLINWSNK